MLGFRAIEGEGDGEGEGGRGREGGRSYTTMLNETFESKLLIKKGEKCASVQKCPNFKIYHKIEVMNHD